MFRGSLDPTPQAAHTHPGRLLRNATTARDLNVTHGSPGLTYTTERLPSWQAWAKPLQGGAVAVLLVRVWAAAADAATLALPLAELFAGDGGRGNGTVPTTVRLRDVHAHTDNGTAGGGSE